MNNLVNNLKSSAPVGRKDDADKLRYDLMDVNFEEEMAKVLQKVQRSMKRTAGRMFQMQRNVTMQLLDVIQLLTVKVSLSMKKMET